ncbi:MAG: inorganic phosphate transporter [Myxococcota bacterium]
MDFLLVALVFAAFSLAFANGANDNFKAVATVYGSGMFDYVASRNFATVAQVTGSLASVALADRLLKAFSGKGLVPDALVADPIFLVAVGLGAATTVLVATRVGLPISTTHALVGGLAGAGLGLAPTQLSWSALGGSYFAPLAISPILAVAIAGLLYPVAHHAKALIGLPARRLARLRGAPLMASSIADGHLLDPDGVCSALEVGSSAGGGALHPGSIAEVRVQWAVERLHVISAFSLGFARGLNDTPKVLALLVAAGWSGLDPRISLLAVALAMAAGGFLRARRVAETLSHGITEISRGQGLVANAISSGLVIGASLLGSPVSTTHVSTGALFGIGAWNDRTDWRTVGAIVGSWLGTLPLAAVLAWTVASLLAGLE